MAAINARGLRKRFETTDALEHVDLLVQEGEVRGLLGPNGAGKTTLLRLLFGLVRADGGSIELLGHSLGDRGVLPLRGVAGFVEEPSFYPYLSGRANLELLAELDGEVRAAQIDGALERVGLQDRAADRVSGYSSGMKQRLGIAASLLHQPRLLLLDEPTAGLDPAGVREVGALVRELSANDTAIVLSSHQIGELDGVCDSFTVLRSGRVVWDGTASELRAQAPAASYGMSTSDDQLALQIAHRHRGISAIASPQRGLALTVEDGSLDRLVLDLAAEGVAVRRLEQLVTPLESMFFALTDETDLAVGEHQQPPARPEQAATGT